VLEATAATVLIPPVLRLRSIHFRATEMRLNSDPSWATIRAIASDSNAAAPAP